MTKIIIENFFSSNMKEKETWLSFIELEFLFSWNTWNIPRRNLATNLQNSRNNSLLFCFSSLTLLPHLSIFTNRGCTNSRPFSPLVESTRRASRMLRQLYLPFVAAFRCQENGDEKGWGEIKSRRRTYSTRSERCIQQFLSARSFHEIPLPPPPLPISLLDLICARPGRNQLYCPRQWNAQPLVADFFPSLSRGSISLTSIQYHIFLRGGRDNFCNTVTHLDKTISFFNRASEKNSL